MKQLSGNPFAATAIQRHAMVTADKTQPAELVMALAAALQGEATLALVYEQRTANLIAHASRLTQLHVAGVQTEAEVQATAAEILTRLGLTKETNDSDC